MVMSVKKKKTVIVMSVIAVLLLVAAVIAVIFLKQNKTPHFGEEVAQHEWQLHPDWSVVRNDAGEESVVAESSGTTSSWNLTQRLAKSWCVSTDIDLVRSEGGRDCARLVFGDDQTNICMAVSVEYSGDGYVQILADVLLNRGGRLEKDGWRNVYKTKTWLEIDPELPLNLSVGHVEEDQLLLITLKQNDVVLFQDFSEMVNQDILDILMYAGLGVHDSFVRFSEFTVEDME